MTASDNPLSRWSRLKREAVSRARAGADLGDPRTGPVGPVTEPGTELDEGGADPKDLPSIDAITVETDIRAFLNSRVPAELTRAALRRAWTSDPAIRDFIGIAESQWDFNDPTSIQGFGPLQGNDDLPALLRRAFSQPAELAGAVAELPIAVEPAAPVKITRKVGTPDQPRMLGAWQASAVERAEIEPDPEQDGAAPPKRRTHGGALPR